MLEKRPESFFQSLKNRPSDDWLKVEEKEILTLFHSASKRVPAYRDFLDKNKINPEKIKTIEDFKLLPPTNKENYFNAYPYEQLFWDGKIQKPLTIHSTSGSTGEPTYFQREYNTDLRREFIIENFFKSNELTITGPTLFIITFGMGIWSAGMGIYTAAYLSVNRNKFPISVVSPGISKVETLKVLRKLATHYKQVIIAGYPPFVKDVLDEASHEGLDVKKMNLRFVFTGETFPEEFRDYLSAEAGVKNIFLDTMNTYGTSEFGATAVETPLSIAVRRLICKDDKVFKGLLGNIAKTPTIAQYVPYFVNFECNNGELFISGDNPTPFIKYQSGDHGGVLRFSEVKETLANHGLDLEEECARIGISGDIYKLPFVYIYERKNLTASLYGVLIYPEFIKTALYDKELSKFLTGKFSMSTKYDKHQNQYLEINLELKKTQTAKPGYEEAALKKIVGALTRKSSEYKELFSNMGDRVQPRLAFWPYEHPGYFTPGNKQKWVNQT